MEPMAPLDPLGPPLDPLDPLDPMYYLTKHQKTYQMLLLTP